jgi:hypothetical protein
MQMGTLTVLWACLVLTAGPGSNVGDEIVPSVVLDASDPGLRDANGVLLWRGSPWSGQVQEHAGPRVTRTTGYLDGLRHGDMRVWHANGTLAQQRFFRHGKREGVHRGWWPNGRLQFVRQYHHDEYDGEQQAFYETGAAFETRHYRDGHEDGQQTQWTASGRVLANYVFKGGKRYGIVGRFDCVTVHGR